MRTTGAGSILCKGITVPGTIENVSVTGAEYDRSMNGNMYTVEMTVRAEVDYTTAHQLLFNSHMACCEVRTADHRFLSEKERNELFENSNEYMDEGYQEE